MDRSRVALAVASAFCIAAPAVVLASGSSSPRRGLMATLHRADGTKAGVVRFIPRDDGKITVRVSAHGIRPPGFHGLHVHTTGRCDPESGFISAGDHFDRHSADHGRHSGDLPPLLAMSDGRAYMKVVTDAFTNRRLRDADGSAVVLHAAPDNLGHIPATRTNGDIRYHSHLDDVAGADSMTKVGGDSGSRLACGVIRKA